MARVRALVDGYVLIQTVEVTLMHTHPSHFIAMSGEHGCIPDHCEWYPTFADAVNDLVSLFELGRTRKTNLRKYRSAELGPQFGAEYCEIVECDCNTPEIHSDSEAPNA